MHPVNSSKPVHHVDVHKSVCPVNSNKSVYPVDVFKSLHPVDVCKPICLVDVCKPFFVDYWKHVTLFLVLLLFAVSINTSVFNRTILYMIIFINILMTYLIFTKFLKCIYKREIFIFENFLKVPLDALKRSSLHFYYVIL